MRLTRITPRFVDAIPRDLEEGILYISKSYGTASHKCACGCGTRVVTPLTPTDWKVIREKNGSVSVFPSIGNWDYPCESHYWIEHNRISWASKWPREQIEAGRKLDRERRAAYFRCKGGPKHNWLGAIATWIKSLLK